MDNEQELIRTKNVINRYRKESNDGNINKDSVKKFLDDIVEIDFSTLRNSDPTVLESLSTILFNLLKKHENVSFHPEKFYLGKNYFSLHARILRLLFKLTPFMEKDGLKDILIYIRTLIKIENDSVIQELSSLLSIKIAVKLGGVYIKIIYEFFKDRLFNKKPDWKPLLMAIKYGSDFKEKYMLFSTIVHLLPQHAFERIHQKNLGSLIVKTFSFLNTKEATIVFNMLILPLRNSENYYVRETFVEILENIDWYEDIKLKYTRSMLQDSHREVRRFARQSKIIKTYGLNETNSNKTINVVVPSKNIGIQVHLIGSPQSNEEKQRDEDNKQQEEFLSFKKIPKNAVIPTLIKGLKNKNPLITRYCWHTLSKDKILSKGLAINDYTNKIRWLNILKKAIPNNENLIDDDSLMSYIQWNIFPIKALHDPLVTFLFNATINNAMNNPRKIIIFLCAIFSNSNESYQIRSKILKEAQEIIKKNAFKELDLILGIIVAPSKKDPIEVMQTLIELFNDEATYNIQGLIGERIREQFNDSETITPDNYPLVDILAKIDVNAEDQETVEQVICFMLFILSQEGGNATGKKIIDYLFKMMHRCQNYALIFFIQDQINLYKLNGLYVLNELNAFLQKSLNDSPKNLFNEAWQSYLNGQHQNSIEKSGILLKEVDEGDNLKRSGILLLKAMNLYQLDQIPQAKECLKGCYTDLSQILYLKAKIKFKELNYGVAIAKCERVISRNNPFYISPFILLHKLYIRVGNYSSAEHVLKKITKLNPRYLPDYFTNQLSYERYEVEYYPFKTGIQYLEQQVAKFINDSVRMLETSNVETTQQNVLKNFRLLLREFEIIFGSKIIRKFDFQRNIDWKFLCTYPHQIERTIEDVLVSVIRQEAPSLCHTAYEIFHIKFAKRCDLQQQIKNSKILSYLQDKANPVNFLETHANIYSAYDFLKKYIISDALKDGYVLGTSKDISASFDVLSGMLQLTHWTLAYDETGVTPSGKWEDTKKFIDALVVTEKPIVLFVPVLQETPKEKVHTIEEVEYLITLMRTKGKLNLYLVFDAYNLLPMFLSNNKNLQYQPFKHNLYSLLTYFLEALGYDPEEYHTHIKKILNYSLLTRLKINFTRNTASDRFGNIHARYKSYNLTIQKLFSGQLTFSEVLKTLMKELKESQLELCKKFSEDSIDFFLVYITLLSNLIINDIDWFGSELQPSSKDLPILIELEDILKVLPNKVENFLNAMGSLVRMDNRLMIENFVETLKNQLNQQKLKQLMEQITSGECWAGVNATIPKDTRNKTQKNLENFEDTNVYEMETLESLKNKLASFQKIITETNALLRKATSKRSALIFRIELFEKSCDIIHRKLDDINLNSKRLLFSEKNLISDVKKEKSEFLELKLFKMFTHAAAKSLIDKIENIHAVPYADLLNLITQHIILNCLNEEYVQNMGSENIPILHYINSSISRAIPVSLFGNIEHIRKYFINLLQNPKELYSFIQKVETIVSENIEFRENYLARFN